MALLFALSFSILLLMRLITRPELGPLVGGFINQYTSWRWTFYVMLIWAGVQPAAIIFLVPETYHPVLLRRKAEKLRVETANEAWQAPIEKLDKSVSQTLLWSCVRPFQLLVFEPMVRILSKVEEGGGETNSTNGSASIYASSPRSC